MSNPAAGPARFKPGPQPRERQPVFGLEGVALVDGRFGLLARGGQRTAARGLLRAQRQLTFGHADQFLVVEYVEIECHDVDRHVFAGFFQVLHRGREVQFPGLDLTVDAHALEKRHGGRDVERSRGLVLLLIGVVARKHAAERGVGAGRSVQAGQAAEPGSREIDAVAFDLQRPLLYVDVVVQGVADTVVERPCRTRRRFGRFRNHGCIRKQYRFGVFQGCVLRADRRCSGAQGGE